MRTSASLFIFTAFLLLRFLPVLAQETDDPFLWLENVDDAKSMEWVYAQNKITKDALTSKSVFKELLDKNLEIYNSKERIAYPSFHGRFIYNFWQDAEHQRGVIRRTTLDDYMAKNPQWETVLDIDALNKTENENWVYKGASWLYPGDELCMLRLSRGGGDAVVMREFNALKKQFVKNGFFLPEAKGSVSWKDENTLLVSTDFGPGSLTTSGYPRISKEWKRGAPLSEAKFLFEGDSSDVSVNSYVIHTPERNYEILSRGMTFYSSKNFVIENGKRIELEFPEDAEFDGIFKNQILLQLKSDWTIKNNTYPQGALISIDYDAFLNGDRNFTIIAVPDERSSIASIATTQNLLLVNLLTNVRSELFKYRFTNAKWIKEKVEAPEFGSIGIAATDDFSDRYFFTYTGFLTPSSLYFVSAEGTIKRLKSLPDFFDAGKFEVHQNEAISKDGTKIPYFIITPKSMKLDGSNPTLLYGYGGFEISLRPRYSAIVGSAWLERGGVYVLANIRGGGEFGPKWHLAALKENRQCAFDDFAAVAEDLIKRKITSPRHLGIQGGSNGGLLVGAVFTQRPELFNAVVCRVPLLDMKRFNHLLAGASWMGEYGNPDIPEEWAYIKKYSPYQNVLKDKHYPVVFFNTSTRDDRVHPGHARKMTAKMEAQGHKVYYYENTEGGHAASTTNKQRAYSSALIYTFLWQQLGK